MKVPYIYRGTKSMLNDKVVSMNITISEIEIIPIKPHNGLLAFTSFILNHASSLDHRDSVRPICPCSQQICSFGIDKSTDLEQTSDN